MISFRRSPTGYVRVTISCFFSYPNSIWHAGVYMTVAWEFVGSLYMFYMFCDCILTYFLLIIIQAQMHNMSKWIIYQQTSFHTDFKLKKMLQVAIQKKETVKTGNCSKFYLLFRTFATTEQKMLFLMQTSILIFGCWEGVSK